MGRCITAASAHYINGAEREILNGRGITIAWGFFRHHWPGRTQGGTSSASGLRGHTITEQTPPGPMFNGDTTPEHQEISEPLTAIRLKMHQDLTSRANLRLRSIKAG
ncbi:hypothetical protein CDAR_124501 [Caerostris darwini]|uniref:Uncharacterized protein n=1 Tax=Caerostris darwini TaxID=1538125 RepID=A0AAV4RNU0_9ARAC|nr:hypothetical protein CDAR_124501 [Caerostris darwini]